MHSSNAIKYDLQCLILLFQVLKNCYCWCKEQIFAEYLQTRRTIPTWCCLSRESNMRLPQTTIQWMDISIGPMMRFVLLKFSWIHFIIHPPRTRFRYRQSLWGWEEGGHKYQKRGHPEIQKCTTNSKFSRKVS